MPQKQPRRSSMPRLNILRSIHSTPNSFLKTPATRAVGAKEALRRSAVMLLMSASMHSGTVQSLGWMGLNANPTALFFQKQSCNGGLGHSFAMRLVSDTPSLLGPCRKSLGCLQHNKTLTQRLCAQLTSSCRYSMMCMTFLLSMMQGRIEGIAPSP